MKLHLALWLIPAALVAGEFQFPTALKHPIIAASPEEIARIKKAFASKTEEGDVVRRFLADADLRAAASLDFPPRGGAHEQNYQCPKHQIKLRTVDATHHRCPIDNEEFSGPPFDDVLFTARHIDLMKTARICAWAWLLTGEKRHFERSRDVLLGYAERYLVYPYHDNFGKQSVTGGHILDQTLDEAVYVTSEIAPAFDLLEPALAPDDKNKIREKLLKPLAANISKHKDGKGNHQTWHNTGLIWLGACLEDAAMIRAALDDEKNGFHFQMKESVNEDGLWYEGTFAYHNYALNALTLTAEGMRRLGVDLWTTTPLRKMFLLPAQNVMPDGRYPRFGDDPGSPATGYAPMLEAGYAALRDKALLPLLPASNTWASIFYGRKPGNVPAVFGGNESRLFEASGHAVLRSAEPGRLTAAFTFAPYGGYHGHFDKLSFVLYGYGNEVAVHPGRAKSIAYELPIHKDWYKASLGHNLVMIDQKSQEPSRGENSLFATSGGFSAASARAAEIYPGFTHKRLLVLTPEYLLVFDRLESFDGAVHRYDWVYHNAGTSFEAPGLAAGPAFENIPGLEYAKNIRRGKMSETLEGNFPGEKVSTRLILQGGAELLAADGPLGSIEERIPFVIARKDSKNAEFLAVIEPVPSGSAASVVSSRIKTEAGVTTIAVKRKSGEDIVRLDEKDFSLQREGRVVLSGKFKSLSPPPAFKLKKNIVIEDFENAEAATFEKTANVVNDSIADSGDPERRKVLQFSGNFSSTPYAYVRKNLAPEKIQKEDIQGIRLRVRASSPLTFGLNLSYQADKEIRYSSRVSATAKWSEVFIPLKSFRREDKDLSLEELRKMTWAFFVLSKGKEGESISIDDLAYY